MAKNIHWQQNEVGVDCIKKFEDNETVIKSRNSKDKQCNGQKIWDKKTNNGCKILHRKLIEQCD
jgi:hypothetical protein